MTNIRSFRLPLAICLCSATLCCQSQPPTESDTVCPLPFSRQELLSSKVRDTYENDNLNLISFPLGGIGSGCIGLAGTGKLIDWEIFNNPNKGFQPWFSFLSVWAKPEGAPPVFKVLEGQLRERLDGPMYLARGMYYEGNGVGPQQVQASGLPRMRECRFVGRFPFARVELADKSLPLLATIEGWSPFIPGDSRESSLPVAILNVSLKNPGQQAVDVALAANVQNCAGKVNEIIRENSFSALFMHDGNPSPQTNSMMLAIPVKADLWQRNWERGHNFMSLKHFVDTFALHGEMDGCEQGAGSREQGAGLGAPRSPLPALGKAPPAKDDMDRVGSLGVRFRLKPGESRTIPVLISWYFPHGPAGTNFYATRWKDAQDVARYAFANLGRLDDETRRFQRAFFSSTLPGTVLEAVSSQLCILRSPTVIRFPNGTLYGWEGCAVNSRLGAGTCNHVWNYQQAIPYLFPDLQRSMLENFLKYGVGPDGAIQHRMPVQQEPHLTKFVPAADGQFGQICQVYRDWQISGDTDWLKSLWPATKKALEYAWVAWDTDRDGLLEGPRLNTLDLQFHSPETMVGSLYQAALLAGEKMATAVGDEDAAKEYRRVFELGKKNSDAKLFNGEYYQQQLPAPGDFQLGSGCLSEQLHGQLYARMLGLEDIYDRGHIHTALKSLFKYNYCSDFSDRINANRVFSVNQDRGLVIATWPHGGKPVHPLLYCDETQIGYEYQVAGNLLYEGFLLEGLTVIRSIRDRFDGKRRNPYCEFEWGNHYARSMANYNAILALSGFRYRGVEKAMWLAPQVNADDFRVFFGVEGGWGLVSQTVQNGRFTAAVAPQRGHLRLQSLHLVWHGKPSARRIVVTAGDDVISATYHLDADGTLDVTLAEPVVLSRERKLHFTLY